MRIILYVATRFRLDMIAFRHLEEGIRATGEENGSGCGGQAESRVVDRNGDGNQMREVAVSNNEAPGLGARAWDGSHAGEVSVQIPGDDRVVRTQRCCCFGDFISAEQILH